MASTGITVHLCIPKMGLIFICYYYWALHTWWETLYSFSFIKLRTFLVSDIFFYPGHVYFTSLQLGIMYNADNMRNEKSSEMSMVPTLCPKNSTPETRWKKTANTGIIAFAGRRKLEIKRRTNHTFPHVRWCESKTENAEKITTLCSSFRSSFLLFTLHLGCSCLTFVMFPWVNTSLNLITVVIIYYYRRSLLFDFLKLWLPCRSIRPTAKENGSSRKWLPFSQVWFGPLGSVLETQPKRKKNTGAHPHWRTETMR